MQSNVVLIDLSIISFLYRVVQKNLAFVIGLPQRFADTQEILKGPDYFGKYGKVFKVVVNRNAAQPGSQVGESYFHFNIYFISIIPSFYFRVREQLAHTSLS